MMLPGFTAERALLPLTTEHRGYHTAQVTGAVSLAWLNPVQLCWARCFGNCELRGQPALQCNYDCVKACGGGGPVPSPRLV
jgi:hypothetical protein